MEQNGTKSQTRGGNTKTPRVKKYRRYCFTLNNYGTEDIKVLETFFSQGKYIFGEEIGPLCGTPHLQGYVAFTNNKRLTVLKEKYDAAAHWERRQGSHAQAKEYSTKTDTREAGPWEKGDELSVFIKSETTAEDLLYCMMYMKYGAYAAVEMARVAREPKQTTLDEMIRHTDTDIAESEQSKKRRKINK